MKRYILYAGVNGAGKSTLYRTARYKDQMPRINTDEILREFGNWRNVPDLMLEKFEEGYWLVRSCRII